MKKKIEYIGERPLYFFEAYYGIEGWIRNKNTVLYMWSSDAGMTRFYYDVTDIRPFKSVWKKALEDTALLGDIHKEMADLSARLIGKFKDLNVVKLSDQELYESYKQIVCYYFKYQNLSNYTARVLDYYGLPELRRLLTDRGFDDPETLIATLTTVPNESYLAREERIFWERVSRTKNAKELERALDQQLEEYAWVGRSYYDEPPLSKKDLKARLKNVPKKEWQKRANVIPSLMKATARRLDKALSNKKIDTEIKTASEILRKSAGLKDETRGLLAEVYYHGEKIFNEVKRRFGFTPEVVKSMRIDEVKNLILNNTAPDGQLIQKRLNGFYVIAVHQGRVIELYGSEARKYVNQHLTETFDSTKTEFEAVPASKGVGRGRVKVVKNIKQAKALKKGDVLVAANTNPSFVPFLKIVSAIIAEEGGVTLHAAVVSRELGIPCVIGLRFATQMFKDGDVVEVDAEKGVVRKLT